MQVVCLLLVDIKLFYKYDAFNICVEKLTKQTRMLRILLILKSTSKLNAILHVYKNIILTVGNRICLG